MPFYPSSATAGTSAGVIAVNNLSTGTNPSYQELKDITTGNDETLDYVSAANYPTDANIGGPWRTGTGIAIGSSTFTDLVSIAGAATSTLISLVQSFTVTATSGAPEQQMSVALQGNTYHNVQSKLEKINRELNTLIKDLGMVSGESGYTANISGTAFANGGVAITTTVNKKPSTWNRYTNSSTNL